MTARTSGLSLLGTDTFRGTRSSSLLRSNLYVKNDGATSTDLAGLVGDFACKRARWFRCRLAGDTAGSLAPATPLHVSHLMLLVFAFSAWVLLKRAACDLYNLCHTGSHREPCEWQHAAVNFRRCFALHQRSNCWGHPQSVRMPGRHHNSISKASAAALKVLLPEERC